MAARRRRNSRKSGSPAAAFAIIGLVVFLSLAGGSFYFLKTRAGEAAALDSDLCPVTGPTSVTAVLLDVTDPISDITRIDLQRQFKNAVSAVEKGGLIEVYTLTEEEGELGKAFRGCNPGDGASADELTSNPKKIQARWEAAFGEPLKLIEVGMGESKEAKHSPIMAGIQRIIIQGFSDPKTNGRPKTLYVASDMMEHTDAFSSYKSGTDYAAFEKSPARNRYRTPLDNINVKFLVFQRDASANLTALPEFWATWVVANHGSFTGYERLAGIR